MAFWLTMYCASLNSQVNTIQAVYNFEVQLGRFYPAWRGPGDWRSRGNMGRGVRGIQPQRGGCFKNFLRCLFGDESESGMSVIS